jgi:hypothetical protein
MVVCTTASPSLADGSNYSCLYRASGWINCLPIECLSKVNLLLVTKRTACHFEYTGHLKVKLFENTLSQK